MKNLPQFILRFWLVFMLALAIGATDTSGQVVNKRGVDPGAFETPVTEAMLDRANDVEWFEGNTKPATTAGDAKKYAIWTQQNATSYKGLTFGENRQPGVRHVRLAFKGDVPVGSVLMIGNCQLSVLKDGVRGPGDPGDESHWTPAQRIQNRSVTAAQPGDGSIVVWVLPPDTSTRAIRLTHTPKPTDDKFEGHVGGLYILRDRVADVSGQAYVTVSANPKEASSIIDGRDSGSKSWASADKKGGPQMISPGNPEWVQLTFPQPVTLRGLNAMSGGAERVEVRVLPESFVGPLAEATESDWKTAERYTGLTSFYPASLSPAFLDLGRPVSVRGVRMMMVKTLDPKTLHPHIQNSVADGKRVGLDELQALMPLGDEPLESAILDPWNKNEAHPPIPIKFELQEPGNVTLVIEDADGQRVRNLVSQTPFPAGENTAWWDGMDDLGRDVDAAHHGLYHVPGDLVEAGSFAVRGMVAPPIELTYEVSVDNAGTPPWPTEDNRGGWGTNHTPPSCLAIVPAERNKFNKELIFIGSYVAEGGHGLFWVDLDGKKQGGLHWTGGHWTGAQTVVADAGDKPDRDTAVYVASGFQGEARFVALKADLTEEILGKFRIAPVVKGVREEPSYIGDLAAFNQLLVASLRYQNALWVFDAEKKQLLGKIDLEDPNALAFEPDGTLLATTGNKLVRIDIDRGSLSRLGEAKDPTKLPDLRNVKINPTPFNLDEPFGIAVLDGGRLAISEQGQVHQVRVYNKRGEIEQTIGQAGPPSVGPYDRLHMNNPDGVVVDSRGRFWIAERHTQPKRVSLWDNSGELLKTWTGPSRYGGGGTLDYKDHTLFYNAGMQFKIDWDTGEAVVDRILLTDTTDKKILPEDRPQFPPDQHHANALPEQAHYVAGRKFFSNWHNANPVTASNTVVIWEDDGQKLLPVAAMGNAYGWSVTESDAFLPQWPKGTPGRNQHDDAVTFFWQDQNRDGVAQPKEMQMQRGRSRGIAVMPDLTFVAKIDDRVLSYPPAVSSDSLGYDFEQPEVLLTKVSKAKSSGGDVYMPMGDGQIVAFPPPEPMSPYSIGGGPIGGEPTWSYPNMWPGLHASHESPIPQFPGMIVGPTRPMGHPITPRDSDLGPLWIINTDQGNQVVFTSDGLFVTTLFHDSRVAPSWRMPAAERGMRVDGLTLKDETFWPSITQVQDTGEIYLSVGVGAAATLVKVHGLEEARRIPPFKISVDQDQLKECLDWQTRAEAQRMANTGIKRLNVSVSGKQPKVDGQLDDWSDAEWATVDQRGTAAFFNSNSKPYNVSAAMKVAGDTLYLAWKTTEAELLANSAEIAIAPFKTGGTLELMIRADPNASGDQPVAGDQRLVITRRDGDPKEGKPWAVHYRAVVPGTSDADRVAFTSPVQSIYIDRVDDVTKQIELAQDDQGNFEAAVPLKLLGISPKPGLELRGDLGVLRGTPGRTSQRVYWSNKATAITADVPSEAMLQPALWGTFVFE